MSSRGLAVGAVLVVWSACGRAAAEPAGPSEAPPLHGARQVHDEGASEARQAMQRLRAEAQDLQRRLAAEAGQAASLMGEVRTLDQRLALAAADAERLQVGAGLARVEAARAALRLQVAGDVLETTRRRLSRLVLALHRAGPEAGWRRLLQAPSDARSAAGATDSARLLASREALAVREVRAANEGAARAAHDAEAAAAQAAASFADARQAASALDRVRELRRQRLAVLSSSRARDETHLAELAAAEEDLARGVGLLAQRPQVTAGLQSPAAVPGAGLGPRRRSLPWPLPAGAPGRIVEGFGTAVHARYGTRTPRKGIVVEAAAGTPIQAVGDGRVVFRDWYKGFGRCIVLDHGAADLTVYAHAAELWPKLGADVRAGDTLGTVGDTGSLDGPRLYFQLQHGGHPEDPEAWLRAP